MPSRALGVFAIWGWVMWQWFLRRAAEPSTWAGLGAVVPALIAAATGGAVTPEQMTAIVGGAAAVLIGEKGRHGA